jgi:hypothetical protein
MRGTGVRSARPPRRAGKGVNRLRGALQEFRDRAPLPARTGPHATPAPVAAHRVLAPIGRPRGWCPSHECRRRKPCLIPKDRLTSGPPGSCGPPVVSGRPPWQAVDRGGPRADSRIFSLLPVGRRSAAPPLSFSGRRRRGREPVPGPSGSRPWHPDRPARDARLAEPAGRNLGAGDTRSEEGAANPLAQHHLRAHLPGAFPAPAMIEQAFALTRWSPNLSVYMSMKVTEWR